MAYAFVQAKSVTGLGVTSVAITFNSNNTVNNRVISATGVGTTDTGSISSADNGTTPNTYHNDNDFNDTVNLRTVIASANIGTVPAGNKLTITQTYGASMSPSVIIAEYSGLSTASGATAVDTTGTHDVNGSGTTQTVTASPNPAAANEAAIATFSNFGSTTYTASGGDTVQSQVANGATGQFGLADMASVAGTTTLSVTSSGNGGADSQALVVYKLAAAAAATVPRPIVVVRNQVIPG